MNGWTLFWTFARIALFTLGGGSATIPHLMELPNRFGWLSAEQMAVIIAVGESAPGPGGVNMASYIGLEVGGWRGMFCAVAGLCLPSIVIITLIATFLKSYSKRPIVQHFFYGLRPAVVAVIISAIWGLMKDSLLREGVINISAFLIFVTGCVCVSLPKLQKVYPLTWIAGAAVLGILFQM